MNFRKKEKKTRKTRKRKTNDKKATPTVTVRIKFKK